MTAGDMLTEMMDMSKANHAVHILAGKVRRMIAVHFRKDYVAHQLQIREGECRQCGTCCNFSFACPLLTRRRRCMVYGVCRPLSCRLFPLDQRDIDDVVSCGGSCGYRFPEGH